MLVDAKNAKKVHSDLDFNFMIQTIANEKGHDLQKFCQAYIEQDWLAAIGTVDHPFDGIEQYRQLIAEWFRRGHDKRVGKIIEDPFEDLGISSPRTELLPNRIYRYLGQICVSHGMSFDALIEKLPYKQTGLGTENCHPRFIGCLLRLGDLFDLDDNRFCPVMAMDVSNMPSVSKHHHNKHLSLREFQLDKRTVKLVAECPDEMSYVETQNWFGWIREEFQNQMSQWNSIVPNFEFGPLPTIEQLDVKIDGNKELLDHKPMKFGLEEKNAIQILQGANLYKDISSILRELIQNAIDATQIRIWLEHQDKLKNLSPIDLEFKSIVKNYPIEIDFTEKLNGWYLSIKDNGVGFSLEDLKYVQKIAGSNKNYKRKIIISKMPAWLKPSSYFGIGLQSSFLLADKISFETKSFITNDAFSVEMNSPLEKNNGYCFINKIEGVYRKSGTKLELPLDIKKLQNCFFVQDNYLKKFGFMTEFEDEKRNLVFLEIIKKIRENFSHDCNIKILFDSEKVSNLNEILDKNKEFHEADNLIFDNTYWNSELNLKLSIRKKNNFSHRTDLKFYFKGQFAKSRVYGNGYRFGDLYDIGVDFYGLNASECLNVNRDSWLEGFVEDFNNSFLNLIIEDILEKRNGFEEIDEEFFNFTNVIYGSDLNCISKINFLTNKGFMSVNEIIDNKLFYITSEYLPKYDLALEKFDVKVFLIIKNIELLDAFVKFVSGFFCYRVDGFSILSIAGMTNIIFSKDEIELEVEDEVKIYRIDSILNSLKYFLETKVLNKCDHKLLINKYHDLSFPIKISSNMLPDEFTNFKYKQKVVLPFYYSYGYIHFITYLDYKKLIDLSLDHVIGSKEYNEFIAFLKKEISKISNVKFTGD